MKIWIDRRKKALFLPMKGHFCSHNQQRRRHSMEGFTMRYLFVPLILLLKIHCSVGADEPAQEPTHEYFDSAAPSAAEDVDSIVPTVALEDADTIAPTILSDDPLVVPKDTSFLSSDDMEIADGALDGIMDPNDPAHKMGAILANIYNTHLGKGSASPLTSLPKSIMHDDGTVSVDVVASGGGRKLKEMVEELEGIGFQVVDTFRHVASGTIPIASLGEMCNCSTLVLAMPPLAVAEKGSVTSAGVRAMGANKVLANLGVNGRGITVGVLSDSYNGLGGAPADMRSGDLPPAARIRILNDSASANGRDEGRAMMQLIHDVAPGANLAFHTAFGGIAVFARGIIRLASVARCQVIVDDIFYTTEPAFQDGILAQAVDFVRDNFNVTYIASGGNYARNSYENRFVNSRVTRVVNGVRYTLHDFGYASRIPLLTDRSETMYLPNRNLVRVILTWDEPFASATPGGAGSTSDLALFIFDPVNGALVQAVDNVNIGMDPIEVANLNVASYLRSIGRSQDPGFNFLIQIGIRRGLFPGRIKVTIVNSVGGFLDYPTNSGSGYGHRQAAGSAAVAAAFAEATPGFGVEPAIVERYSSAGGVPILFDKQGNRRPNPLIRRSPQVTGPDGGQTTFFGSPVGGRRYFFGTSAAAPHVAAVAALILDANPSLNPRVVHALLAVSSQDMLDPTIPGNENGFDFRTGRGFVNASQAVETVLAAGRSGNHTRNLRGVESVIAV